VRTRSCQRAMGVALMPHMPLQPPTSTRTLAQEDMQGDIWVQDILRNVVD